MIDAPANDNVAVHILTYLDEGLIVVIVFDSTGGIITEDSYHDHASAHEAILKLVPRYPHATIDDGADAMQIPSTPGGAA